MSDRLVMFLYLLMRDEQPTGVVERLVHEATRTEGIAVYSAKPLEVYARDIASRLTAEKGQP